MTPATGAMLILWTSSLLTVGVAALLYANAEWLQSLIESAATGVPGVRMRRLSIGTRVSVAELAKDYVKRVQDLISSNKEGHANGQAKR